MRSIDVCLGSIAKADAKLLCHPQAVGFVFRPLSGKQNKPLKLALCGEPFRMALHHTNRERILALRSEKFNIIPVLV
jgi:hypothetical protein